MAFTKKTEKQDHEIRVERAAVFKNGNVGFSAEVNGIMIYGFTLVTYKDKKSGKERTFVSMPQRQSASGEYYNVLYIDFSENDLDNIDKQLHDLLD